MTAVGAIYAARGKITATGRLDTRIREHTYVHLRKERLVYIRSNGTTGIVAILDAILNLLISLLAANWKRANEMDDCKQGCWRIAKSAVAAKVRSIVVARSQKRGTTTQM